MIKFSLKSGIFRTLIQFKLIPMLEWLQNTILIRLLKIYSGIIWLSIWQCKVELHRDLWWGRWLELEKWRKGRPCFRIDLSIPRKECYILMKLMLLRLHLWPIHRLLWMRTVSSWGISNRSSFLVIILTAFLWFLLLWLITAVEVNQFQWKIWNFWQNMQGLIKNCYGSMLVVYLRMQGKSHRIVPICVRGTPDIWFLSQVCIVAAFDRIDEEILMKLNLK